MSSNPNNSQIIVRKRERTLLLYMQGRLERAYPVALGRNWADDKAAEGDAPRDEQVKDWTRGCIALANSAMRDLYDLVELGTPVIISA